LFGDQTTRADGFRMVRSYKVDTGCPTARAGMNSPSIGWIGVRWSRGMETTWQLAEAAAQHRSVQILLSISQPLLLIYDPQPGQLTWSDPV
jgi:hypothetical protein